MKVRLTEPAEFDLERLLDTVALTDPGRAAEIAEKIQAAAAEIGRAPLRCPPISTHPRCRKKAVRPYLMLFDVRDDCVLILRIAHERSDWVALV